MIKFLKIAPYSPLMSDTSKYDSLKRLTLGQYDPAVSYDQAKEALNKANLNLLDFNIVYLSQHKRAKGTLDLLKDQESVKRDIFIETLEELNEINFDMEKICSREDYEKHGTSLVRKRFVELFIDDRLADKRVEIKRRFDLIRQLIQSKKSGNILFISHTFFIRLFQLYIQVGEELFENPEIIQDYIDSSKRIMEYLELTEIAIIDIK